MKKLDPYGAPAQYLLAQKGVKVDAAQPRLFLALAWGLTRLVVGNYQLSLLVELEAVYDAAQTQRFDTMCRAIARSRRLYSGAAGVRTIDMLGSRVI